MAASTTAQHFLPPPRHAHRIERLACEDDLPHRFPACALAFQVGAYVHSADFAIRRADDQHDGVSLLLPVIGPTRVLDLNMQALPGG